MSCVGAFLLFVPKDDFFLFESCFHIDDALVGGTAKAQGDILECFYVSSVYQNVDEREHLVGDLAPRAALGQQVAFEGVARVAPHRFIGIGGAESPQKRQQRTLVTGLKGLAAQQRQPADIIGRDEGDDLVLGVLRVGLTVGEIPRFGVEASFAMMGAARNEKRHADAQPVRDVLCFYLTPAHQRCRTRSLISWVRP